MSYRFAILEHDHPVLHWDLLLESGDALRAWRLAAPPASAPDIAAEPLPDHRPLYLDYEGPIGGGRGRVTRWDAGTFDLVAESADRLELRLRGSRVAGSFILGANAGGAWRFHRAPD